MMEKPTRFQPYDREQLLLLPADMREWVPEGHLAHFICDVVETLDLSEIYADYDGARGGKPPFHPQMTVSLLMYAYCVGVASSRRIERATYESLPFLVIAANQHPDHDTMAEFRKRHLAALARLFVQVLAGSPRISPVSVARVGEGIGRVGPDLPHQQPVEAVPQRLDGGGGLLRAKGAVCPKKKRAENPLRADTPAPTAPKKPIRAGVSRQAPSRPAV